MRAQTTTHILMVRPSNFAFNEETAASNAFQSRDGRMTKTEMQQYALQEFDEMVSRLRAAGVDVLVIDDTASPAKPDAIFPNNWISFHQEGFIVTYPMFAPTRRLERRQDVVDAVLQKGF
ncbi:MAG: amidinotransferase, partial [Saprospiraceae bacterium]|nr:amidinotransferase [Saprospiraceae bacterium]